MNYDPFKILNVSYTADLNTVREAFKVQALKFHPDRGGSPYYFDLCKKAYNDIYKYKKQQERQLRKEQRNISKLQQERSGRIGPELNRSQQKQLQRNFNQIFQNVRVENANDVGYGDVMEKSSKIRDDKPKLRNGKRFNKNQLVVYEEPKALPTIKENYEVLGEGKIKDFSNHSKGYTDYMVAHSEQDLSHKPHERLQKLDNVRNRKKVRSVDELRSVRSNISYEMSPQEQRNYEMKKRREHEMEEKRKMQFYKHKQHVQKKFNQIHNYLTY